MARPLPLLRRRRERPATGRPRDPDAREDRLVFFRSFLERPREVASIIPSSRFLERRVVRAADVAHAKLVVELGPGTGGTTRAMLRAMGPDAKLLAIEINPRLARRVRNRVADRRLIVHEGSATDLEAILAEHGLGPPEVVFSGIPFSQLPRDVGLAILRAVERALAPGGRFVAYQARDRVRVLGSLVFGRPRSEEREVRNVPPMSVYRFEPGGEPASGATASRKRRIRSR